MPFCGHLGQTAVQHPFIHPFICGGLYPCLGKSACVRKIGIIVQSNMNMCVFDRGLCKKSGTEQGRCSWRQPDVLAVKSGQSFCHRLAQNSGVADYVLTKFHFALRACRWRA